jgi:ring-1,2-phenylacetyl-CoA epoxidase subunit PaaE
MGDVQFRALRIASVHKETDAASAITFEVPEALTDEFRFKPGQYLTLRATIDGHEVRRSYSVWQGVHSGALAIAVKRVTGGVFSNWLNDHARPGMLVDVAPPQGQFSVALAPENRRHYCFIASGSGITPVLSNLSSVLAVEPQSHVTLLYGNQRLATMMFRETLSFLKNAHLQRFHWINIFSREDQGCDILNGRLNNRKGAELNRRLINLAGFDEFYICGPESMISEVSRGLRQFGIADTHVHFELFAASAEDARQVMAHRQARIAAHAGRTSEVTLIRDGRATTFTLAADGENVLDAGLSQGLDLPWSCKGGVCSTCKARLLQGSVDMDITHGLAAGERAAGFILTCQAHPLTDQVVIDFDQR